MLGLDGSYVTDFLFQDPRHGDGSSANGRITGLFSINQMELAKYLDLR